MPTRSLLGEFIVFLKTHKLWWIGSVVLILLAIAIVAVFSGARVIPFLNIPF